MRSVGLKVLKNKLSEYVRIAANGETVLVVDRDRVVAELGPPRSEVGATLADAQLRDMVRRGILQPATAPAAGPPPRKPVPGDILGELDDDRADR